MGSIVAILSSGPSRPDLARKMLSAAPHHGGDFVVKTCGCCILGVSNNNEIIDSMISSDGDLISAFTGRLTNIAELVESLSRLGFRQASTNPADILVSAFQAFGSDARGFRRRGYKRT